MEDQKTTPKRSPRPKQSLAEVLLRTKNLSEGLKANAEIMNKYSCIGSPKAREDSYSTSKMERIRYRRQEIKKYRNDGIYYVAYSTLQK